MDPSEFNNTVQHTVRFLHLGESGLNTNKFGQYILGMFQHWGASIFNNKLLYSQHRACNENVIFLFLKQNICCGYSKELSQWDSSFENQKNRLNETVLLSTKNIC